MIHRNTIDTTYRLLPLPRAPQDRTDTTVSKLLLSSSVYKRTTKNKLQQERYI